jgi:hypothetical protein
MSTYINKPDHSVKHIQIFINVDSMVIYITFLLSFPRARQLYHTESLQPLEQHMRAAVPKEMRKEAL